MFELKDDMKKRTLISVHAAANPSNNFTQRRNQVFCNRRKQMHMSGSHEKLLKP